MLEKLNKAQEVAKQAIVSNFNFLYLQLWFTVIDSNFTVETKPICRTKRKSSLKNA
jgi:hypothetical protein